MDGNVIVSDPIAFYGEIRSIISDIEWPEHPPPHICDQLRYALSMVDINADIDINAATMACHAVIDCLATHGSNCTIAAETRLAELLDAYYETVE